MLLIGHFAHDFIGFCPTAFIFEPIGTTNLHFRIIGVQTKGKADAGFGLEVLIVLLVVVEYILKIRGVHPQMNGRLRHFARVSMIVARFPQ